MKKRCMTLALLLALPVPVAAQSRDTATVVVTHPTVVAYLVVPTGAVDSSADLAVLADDWNVAMATLGDSLSAYGIRLALVTQPMLRMRLAGRRDVMFVLDEEPAAGYVFAQPGMAPCLRRGAAEVGDVLRAAGARAKCSARAR
ncbi:MAG: hypothetical protein ACJ79A_06465 [Gemmatimonadaceae bacterium]